MRKKRVAAPPPKRTVTQSLFIKAGWAAASPAPACAAGPAAPQDTGCSSGCGRYYFVKDPYVASCYDTAVGYCDIDVPPACMDGIDNDCDMRTDAQDEGCICPSPVLVDTRGDGFDLTDGASGVQFDINMDGLKDSLSWTAAGSDDAWLALDRNGNGRIDGGGEPFGNYTPQPASPRPNGFLALAEYEGAQGGGNADGMIDGRDSVFSSLRLWRDANHDGISQPGELHTLPSLDIESISLSFREVRRRDRYGNGFRYQAEVMGTKNRITRRLAYDVILVAGQ